VLVALALLGAILAVPGTAGARARFDTRVLAIVPTPGFPAHAYTAPNGRVYVGTYTNPSGDRVRSRVFEYEGDGTLLRSWTVRGQDLSRDHGVQVATSDGDGRLILLDKSPARAILLDRRTGEQRTIARFGAGSIPNFGAWGPDGSLYVTDYGQPVIWRIAPGGGAPQQWLRDPRLDGGEFGATGIMLMGDRRTLAVAVQSQAGLGVLGNPSTGRLFTVPIGPGGRPGALRQLWESRPADGPDGFAIARSGTIYMALLVANQIAVIGPNGVERERFPSVPLSGDNGSPIPFDSPSSVRFLGTRLMVANQSYFQGDPSHHAILDVESGEPGLSELVPPGTRTSAAQRPAVAKRRVPCRELRSAKRRRACRHRAAVRRCRKLKSAKRRSACLRSRARFERAQARRRRHAAGRRPRFTG
jgi:sugar lactone lactonase YvrE